MLRQDNKEDGDEKADEIFEEEMLSDNDEFHSME